MALRVPFFRPDITDAEVDEVVAAVRSGWLTSGPRTKRFETEFAQAVSAQYALALNSCTAALHLAVEALGLKAGDVVLVPAMTFAATAEVVRYMNATPLLVDCDPVTLNFDLDDAEEKIARLRAGTLPGSLQRDAPIKGIMPVHVGGLMMDIDAIRAFAARHDLWIVEDAAHALPAAWRKDASSSWQHCGQGTAHVTCFSFYANKTMTTGEGGMAVTDDKALADRMRLMALHGLSHDAWDRYAGGRTWDYRIIAPGFKYNMTDMASALGLVQLSRAESMRTVREGRARRYVEALSGVPHLELPPSSSDRIHSWHLFPVRLKKSAPLSRNELVDTLKDRGIGTSVHWRPLHLHPYYQETYGWQPEHLPVASAVWESLVTLPLSSTLTDDEQGFVVEALIDLLGAT